MEPRDFARQLLMGPRGRGLCLSVSGVDFFSVLTETYLTSKRPDLLEGNTDGTIWLTGPLWTPDSSAALARAVRAAPAVGGKKLKGRRLLEALSDEVAAAAYWEPPHDEERATADAAVIDALQPVAEAVAAAPAASWWDRPFMAEDQQYVSWIDTKQGTRATPPPLSGVADRLTRWRQFRAGVCWWSTPDRWDVVSTAPSTKQVSALQLALIEDEMGWRRARVARLAPRPDARVFEIAEAQDWVHLVERYPLSVGGSNHDWSDLTEHQGPWLIPDWSRVATDYDGVHLTVLAYLSATGRALPVAEGATMIAGWEPDTTFWLTDALTQAEDPTLWIKVRPLRSATRWREG